MTLKYISLEVRDNSRLTRIFQLIFGIVCIAVAIYWAILSINELKSGTSVWFTIAFLTCFGGYLVWISMGYGQKFIGFGDGMIRLKKNSFLPPEEIKLSDIEMIEIYPLKFIIRLKSARAVLTRFGVNDVERIELIKDELMKFSTDNNISVELKNEL